MSKNRNRAKLSKARSNREYNIIRFTDLVDKYCPICSQRWGKPVRCGGIPQTWKRNWKDYRKTQYK